MKHNIRKTLAVFVLSILVFSSQASYAAQLFTDVPEDYWAMPYIIKVVDNNIMPGYTDATYKPSAAATKLEVITSIYNAIVASDRFDSTQGDVLSLKFGSTISSANIPKTLAPYGENTWAAIGYALENDIVHPDELKGFVIEGELAEATKMESAVFIGKALNIFLEEDLQRIISFDYKDAFSITSAAAPYVDLLIQNQVISSNGDEKGNFNPKQVVTREVLATIMSGTYGVLSGDIDTSKSTDASDTESSQTVTVEGSKTYEAIISIVHESLEIIELRDGGGKLHVYDGSATDIVKDGSTIELKDVAKGMDVTVYEKDGDLTKLVINKQFDKDTGTFEAKSDELKDDDGKYRVITVATDDGKKYYKAYASSVIVKDGDTAELSDLDDGDKVHINAEGFMIREIEAYSPNIVVSGILNRTTDFKKDSSLSVQLEKGSYIDQVLSQDIDVVSPSDSIHKGDIVKVTLEYGVVVKVEATGMSSELAGTVKAIHISATPEIIITTAEGDEKIVPLNSDMTYTLEGGQESGSIYDLRLDQNVTMKMDGTGVTSLIMNKAVDKVKFKAEIVEIYQTANLLKVKDDDGQTWTVSFKEGASVSIMDYEVGTSVFIFGIELSDDLFEAELVIGME